MSLLKLKSLKPNEFDAISEAKRVLKQSLFIDYVAEAYVFGSAVDGRFSEVSDIDILVVFSSLEDIKKAQKTLFRSQLSDWPIDWVFKEKADFDKRSEVGGVCFMAKHHGVQIL